MASERTLVSWTWCLNKLNQKIRKRSSSKSAAAADSPPLRGGFAANVYSARAPRRTTFHGRLGARTAEDPIDFAQSGDYFDCFEKPTGHILISPPFRGRGSQEGTT